MNDAGTPEEINYAYITGQSTDITDGTEDGELQFYTMKDGTLTNTMTMQSGNVGIGQSPSTSLDIIGAQSSTNGNLRLASNNSTSSGITFFNTSTGDVVASRKWGIMSNYQDEGDLVIRMSSSSTGNLDTYVMVLDANSRISLSNNDGNTYNTVLGYRALTYNGTVLGDVGADYNVAIGHLSMGTLNTTDATNNTAVGYLSLRNIVSGDANVAIGSSAGTAINTGSENVAVGKDSMLDAQDGAGNTAIGTESLANVTSGSENVGVGKQALYTVTTVGGNTAVGYQALKVSTVAGSTAVGHSALIANTTGTGNVAVGYQAAVDITAGSSNTVVGHGAMDGSMGTNSEDSSANTAIGKDAMGGSWANQQLDDCVAVGQGAMSGALDNCDGTVAVGKSALAALTSGAGNTAIGYEALKAQTDGTHNVAVGYQSLDAADSGESQNVAIGSYAGGAINDSSSDNNVLIGHYAGQGGAANMNSCVAVGSQAMDGTGTISSADNVAIGLSALGGSWAGGASNKNIAIGSYAMDAAMNGSYSNIAIGYDALGALTHGDANIAIGAYFDGTYKAAMNDNVTGSYCIAIGSGALQEANEDDNDGSVAIGYGACNLQAGTGGAQFASATTAVGYKALTALTTGAGNTAVGYQAGNILTTGGTNTIIGHDADVDANDRAGCIVIGSGLSLNTASDNVVEIGNNTNSMTYDLDGGDITVTSDVRTKKNIKDTKLGLEFINKLRPITYQTKSPSQYPKEFGIENPSKKSSGKTWDGLIAQEVKEVMDEMDVGFSGWEEGINTKQRLAYGKFVMPLIKAVQELTAKVEALEKK